MKMQFKVNASPGVYRVTTEPERRQLLRQAVTKAVRMGTALGELLLSERQMPLHIAGRLVADEWGAKRVPSLQIEDAAAVS